MIIFYFKFKVQNIQVSIFRYILKKFFKMIRKVDEIKKFQQVENDIG